MQTAREQRRNRQRSYRVLLILLIIAVIATVISFVLQKEEGSALRRLENAQVPDWVAVDLIPVDGHSRRGEALEDVTGIVIHYVGNPGTTAKQNRNYYTNADSTVSSHFVVGLEGEVIQCVPLNEKSSASNSRNRDTISIEVCHPDSSGKFNDETYAALVKLTAWLVETCGLEEDAIIRHYDITGKECPRYFVQDPAAWEQFKDDVMDAVKG